jgi:hypothetical protein
LTTDGQIVSDSSQNIKTVLKIAYYDIEKCMKILNVKNRIGLFLAFYLLGGSYGKIVVTDKPQKVENFLFGFSRKRTPAKN